LRTELLPNEFGHQFMPRWRFVLTGLSPLKKDFCDE
jgi:hypothetical protein